MKTYKILMLTLAIAVGGCATKGLVKSATSLKSATKEIRLAAFDMEGPSPFCVWSPKIFFDNEQLSPSRLAKAAVCTSTTPRTGHRDFSLPYFRTSVGENYPYWNYKSITVQFKKTEDGPYLTYWLPMSGLLDPRPASELNGLRLIITEQGVAA